MHECGTVAVKGMRNAEAVHHVWPRPKSPLLKRYLKDAEVAPEPGALL